MKQMKEEDRVSLWNDRYFEQELNKLPPRIREDIRKIPFPDIPKVESTYLYSDAGYGKTIQAIFMMLSELRNKFVERNRREALFISVPELLFEFRKSYSNQEENVTEADLVKKYSEVYLLVLDDFGITKTTDWSFQMLYLVINRRYENMKKTIFTSNFNLEELSERLGDDRIPSRIQQMCEVIKFGSINYRAIK